MLTWLSWLGLLACVLAGTVASAADIIWGGSPCEVSVAEVTARTVRVVVAPLDAAGQPAAIPATAAFLNLPVLEKFRARSLDRPTEVQAANLHITLTRAPLKISVHRADGRLVQELMLADDAPGTMRFNMKAPVFGLGEGERQFDRRGGYFKMINGQLMPMRITNGDTVPVPFLLGADGWSFFVRAPWGQFDLRGEQGVFLPPGHSPRPQPLTVYLSAWDEPADALQEYIRLTGRPVLPPKWVLGYMQSHRTLLGPDDAVQIAKKFRDDRLPIDAVIYLGTGYCPLGWNLGHGSLEFNPESFPHPAEQIKALHDLNLKVVLHVNHAPVKMFGTSLAATSASPLFIGNYWKQHLPCMALGVDGWWPDDGNNQPIEACLARQVCYYEGPLSVRPNERPWDLQRNAYAGAARYGGWIWSGDVYSKWATLAAHVSVGLNSSLSLTPFWGTDIGGFIATPEMTGELYARWFQFAAFTPLFRSHGRSSHLHLPWGWNTGEAGPLENRDFEIDPAELHNAAVEPVCRRYLELRYRLLPYNYTLMRESVDTGLPAMRALWLHYPNDPVAVSEGGEYLWGRDLLIAPVVEKGAVSRRLYLPVGTWYDWWTGAATNGGRWLDYQVDLATLPIYVRAGAILPLDPVRQYTAQSVSAPTTIRVYPGADGNYMLYDDDGRSQGYLTGADASLMWIRFRWDDRARCLTLEPDARMQHWPGGTREFVVELAGAVGKSRSVSFAGKLLKIQL